MNLKDEKEKATFVHKLEMQKLITEKILFGIIIVIVGVIANFVLEEYRSGLAKDRFLLEKQYQAVTEIKIAYEVLSKFFDDYTVNIDKTKLPDDYDKKHGEKIDAFLVASNKWEAILPKKFVENMQYFLWIHIGVKGKGMDWFRSLKRKDRLEHRMFMYDVCDYFYSLCRETLSIEKEENQKTFELVKISYADASELTGEGYYDLNFKKWAQMKR